MKPDFKGLMKLGRFLARLPKKNFNQQIWFREDSCATTGCVAGWAATIFPHRFKKIYIDDPYLRSEGETHYDIVHRTSRHEGSEAFARGFRISLEDADTIVDGGAHRNSPKIAARAIFRLVKKLKNSNYRYDAE